jgi:hypothetical protein
VNRAIVTFLLVAASCCYANEPPEEPAFVRKVTSIRLPKIQIETASAIEVFSFIGHKVLQFDPDPEPAARGISFFTVGDIPTTSRTVNYVRDDILVGKLLQDIAELYSVEIHITSVGAIMTGPNVAPFPNVKAAKGSIYKSYKPTSPSNAK